MGNIVQGLTKWENIDKVQDVCMGAVSESNTNIDDDTMNLTSVHYKLRPTCIMDNESYNQHLPYLFSDSNLNFILIKKVKTKIHIVDLGTRIIYNNKFPKSDFYGKLLSIIGTGDNVYYSPSLKKFYCIFADNIFECIVLSEFIDIVLIKNTDVPTDLLHPVYVTGKCLGYDENNIEYYIKTVVNNRSEIVNYDESKKVWNNLLNDIEFINFINSFCYI
jgi:hypothetical protein